MGNHLSSAKMRDLVKKARVVLEKRFDRILKEHGVHAEDSLDNDPLQGNYIPPIAKLYQDLDTITNSLIVLNEMQRLIKPHKKSAGDKNE